MAHVQYLPFVFYEIIHQSLAQILEAHVIENMIATSKRISKRCVVTRCRAQEDTSIIHSLVPSEPGGKWDDQVWLRGQNTTTKKGLAKLPSTCRSPP